MTDTQYTFWDDADEVDRPPLPEIYDIREEPLIGVYVTSRQSRVRDKFNREKSEDGKRAVMIHTFLFRDKNGKHVAVFGKPDLDGRLAQVEQGDIVRIEVTGEQLLPNGNKMTTFRVQRKRGNEATQRAASAAAAGAVPSGAGGDENGFVGDDDIPF